MEKRLSKRGNILIENVLFIILNLVFLTLIIIFLWRQGTGAVAFEQTYSKQIALMIDSSKPVMEIKLDMEKAKKIAEENEIDFEKAVTITGNIVRVKLSDKGGYEYSFFNDVEVNAFPEKKENEYTGIYVFTINKNDKE